MTSVRGIARRVIPQAARDWINTRWVVRWARIRYRNSRVIAPNLRRQLAWRATRPAILASGARILVPLIETSHYQYYQILALAKALQLRGAEVRVLLCDSVLDGCELRNSRRHESDQCLGCRANARDFTGMFGLDVVRLSQAVSAEQRAQLRALARDVSRAYPARHEYKGVDVIGMTNDSVTRFFYGDVPPEGSAALVFQRERSLYSAFVGVDVAERMHQEWKPTALMNSMSVYSDWAPYAQYFRKRGIPYHLVAMAPYDFRSVMLNYEELYEGTERFAKWRASRRSPLLEPEELRALDAFLDQRFAQGGGFERHWGWFAEGSALRERADRTKRNIFLFSNLSWDVGINYEGTLFRDVHDWVLTTVEAVAGRDDCHLYVKIHPEESYGSAHTEHGVAQAIRARYPVLPPNVTIITPEEKVKPYELFPVIDLGVVYNGTIGLEMMLRDIPVVATGAAPYSGFGFCLEPRTRAEYADALLGRVTPPVPDREVLRLFAYFYFIKTHIPFHLTRQVYFDDFKGYAFERLDDLLPGRDRYLDHLCKCILHPDTTVIEAWQ